MKKIFFILFLLFVVSCATNTPKPKSEPSLEELRKLGPAKEVKVSVGDNFYNPKQINISPDTIVIWKNEGNIGHNMVVYETQGKGTEDFTSPIISSGVEYAKKFTIKSASTSYFYYCTLHGKQQSGKIIVDAK